MPFNIFAALKKYGLFLPDFNVNSPNSKALASRAKLRNFD
jgi:hypothetical protein